MLWKWIRCQNILQYNPMVEKVFGIKHWKRFRVKLKTYLGLALKNQNTFCAWLCFDFSNHFSCLDMYCSSGSYFQLFTISSWTWISQWHDFLLHTRNISTIVTDLTSIIKMKWIKPAIWNSAQAKWLIKNAHTLSTPFHSFMNIGMCLL